MSRLAARGLVVALVSALAVAGLYAWLTRPLVFHWGTAIPSSAQNIEHPPVVHMVPGDHLQLLYHFELSRGMLTGQIPPFCNPFEFNFGQEARERYRPSAGFLPLSGIYAALAGWIGSAAAWNTTGLLALILSAFFTWLWLGRFETGRGARALGTLVALVLPFRWISLLGGSPAGFALLWLPLLGFLTDRAVREARFRDGFWLGAALMMCGWADLQVFFFAVLAFPVLVALSCVAAPCGWRGLPWLKAWRLLPGLLLFAGLTAAYHGWRHAALAGSLMGKGRSWTEVRLFSPTPRGLLSLTDYGADQSVYLGWMVILLLLGALLLGLSARRKPRGEAVPFGLWLTGLACVLAMVLLALGANGPADGWPLRMIRRFFPFYSMIRQPAKIYCLMVLALPWLVAVGWGSLARGLRPRVRVVLQALFAAGLMVEASLVIRCTVCELEFDQPAYSAVARDARARGGAQARALVLPIWPGDSADSSVFLHHAMSQNLWLVNGYSPVVSKDYFEKVFRFLESANQGRLDGAQVAALRERGIGYVLLHENLFPEKVSPFPVTATRDRLLAHPSLELLARSGPVWAFRVVADHAEPPIPESRTLFPARRWEFEDRAVNVADERCSGGAYRAWGPGGTWETPPWRLADRTNQYWMVRVRGDGLVRWRTLGENVEWGASESRVQSAEWTWLRLPVPAIPVFGPVRLAADVIQGRIDADCGRLVAGEWEEPLVWAPGASRSFPAQDFFHAGHSDPADGSVRFHPETDRAGAVLYGPKLPLVPGRYALEWEIEAEAPAGTVLGWFNVRFREADEGGAVILRSGDIARVEWEQTESIPVNWVVVYNRAAPMTVRRAVLTRLR